MHLKKQLPLARKKFRQRVPLPKDQQIITLEGSVLAGDAIERMLDQEVAHIPVTNEHNTICGVFTWQSFATRVVDLRDSSRIKPTDLPIRDAMGPARFIGPDVYIDTETDWSEIDHVLVGTSHDLLGILRIADAMGRLNDFAEAFVPVYEIEHEIRDIIRMICDDATLAQMINGMSLPPGQTKPDSLDDFSFSQYKLVICSKTNWDRFEPIFAKSKDLVGEDLHNINRLRNDIVHFRRVISPATPTDCEGFGISCGMIGRCMWGGWVKEN